MRFNLKQEFLYNFNEILLWVKPVITEDVYCWASTSGLMATNASGYWWLVLSKRVALVGKDVCRRLIAVRLLFPFDPLCLFFSTPLPPFGVHEAALFFSISLSLSLSLYGRQRHRWVTDLRADGRTQKAAPHWLIFLKRFHPRTSFRVLK